MKKTIAVLVLIETDDQRLWPENLDVSTVAKTHELRSMVVAALPQMTRLVMVTSEESAQLMAMGHQSVMQELGATVSRPPPEYSSPAGEGSFP